MGGGIKEESEHRGETKTVLLLLRSSQDNKKKRRSFGGSNRIEVGDLGSRIPDTDKNDKEPWDSRG